MVEVNKLQSPQLRVTKKPNNPQISFKGHEVDGNKVKFFIPGKKADEGKSYVTLFDTSKKEVKGDDIKAVPLTYKDGMLSADVALDKADTRYAYHFLINGEEKVDITQTKKFFDRDFAITRDPRLVELKRPHQIYHVVPDNFNPADTSKAFDIDGNPIWRNHFNLYGGNIKGVIEKLDYIKELGAARIMGTPIFGADNVSCHGYWTQNPYQIATNMGNDNDFNKLQLELFKRGMGWIADGAFVNQGLMGVQFQDVLRRAATNCDESPFKDWFTFFEDPGPNFTLGVLPQDDNGNVLYENFTINFVNAPVDKKGNENANYDASKPTYLKLSDPRGNHSNSDVNISYNSVQPYQFPIDPEELKEKFEFATEFDADGTISDTELLEWRNFNLDASDYDSDKLLWDGNRDVLKMNMKNPEVREYIMGAATFWTNKVDNTLLAYVAENLEKQLAGKEPTAGNIKNAIDQLEAGKVLPQGASDISVSEIEEALSDNNIAKVYATLKDAVRAYPVEAVELPREALGVVTNPKFKASLLKMQTSAPYEQVIDKILNSDKLSEDNRSKLVQPETLRLFADQVAKTILVKSMTGIDLLPGDQVPTGWNNQVKEALEKNLPAGFFDASNDVCADHLASRVKSGLATVDPDAIAERLNGLLEDIQPKNVRVAKAILGEMESGLDWRIDAAKDVADMDGVRNERVTHDEAFSFVKEFWAEFSNNVRNINPKSFIVGEVTDVPDDKLQDFVQHDGFSTLSNYRYMFGAPYTYVHAHPELFGWHNRPNAFFNELQQFAKAWPVTAVNTAHNMNDNHDKTRVLQNLLIHPGEFAGKGPSGAMGDLMKWALAKSYNVDEKDNKLDVLKLNPDFKAVYEAVDKVAQQEGTKFGYWPMERAIDAIIKKAGVKDLSIGDKMSKVLFDEATDKYIRMLYLMVGCPGAPEMYAGTEFAMTGGETVSKNVFNQNRNPIPWLWLDGNKARPEVQQFNKKVSQIYGLRNNKQLKALNTGFIKDVGHKDDDKGVLAFLRYNSQQQALVILNSGNVNESSNAANLENGDLEGNLHVRNKGPLVDYKLTLKDGSVDKGTVFVNGENPKEKYIVWKDGSLRQKPANVNSLADVANYKGAEPKGLTIEKGLILFREQEPQQQQQVAFTGRKILNITG